MKVEGKSYRSIWLRPDGWSVEIIDQTRLPHEFVTVALSTLEEAGRAIRTMQVRGAPLIGITAAFGLAHAFPRTPLQRIWSAPVRRCWPPVPRR